MQTTFLGLVQCFLHDLGSDTVDLDIHLERGHTLLGAGDFEVHVAEMILVTENIRQHGKAIIFLDQTHCDSRNRGLQRYTRIHQRQARATDAGHGR